MSCSGVSQLVGCYKNTEGDTENVVIHNSYDSDGVVYATLYLDSQHNVVDGADASNVTVGHCPVIVEVIVGCVDNADPDLDPVKRLWNIYSDGTASGPIDPESLLEGYNGECC